MERVRGLTLLQAPVRQITPHWSNNVVVHRNLFRASLLRLTAALVVAILGAFAGASETGAPTPARAAGDPPDVVINRWTAAGSAGDVDRALALCDPNVSFTLQYTLSGRVVPMGGLKLQGLCSSWRVAAGFGCAT